MILIENLPTEIQIPIHLQSNGVKRVVLYNSVGKDAFTTDSVSVDGLHYKLLLDGMIEEGTYRYQVEENNKVLEVGLLKYKKPSQDEETYEDVSDEVLYYEWSDV